MKKNYTTERLEDGVLSYDCSLCPKSFLEKFEIENHISEKHNRKVDILKNLKRTSLVFTKALSDYDCVPLQTQEEALKLLNESIEELEYKNYENKKS